MVVDSQFNLYNLKRWAKRSFVISTRKQDTLIKLVAITAAAILSYAVRLFSVLRFESVIHEFDPYFNYRTTKYLADEGYYSFHNWFDEMAWYPLGRIIGGTIYPGLMVTAALQYHIMNALHLSIDVRNICVFLAPLFSSFTTIVTYLLTTEVSMRPGAGLLAAAFISVVPGYISRSVAGSYDNEGIAIFCMLLTFYFWVKAVKTGSILWSALCALAYFYMVSSWGGYVFLINIIPMHVLVLMITGRFSHRIYIAYSILYCTGTILAMQIPFVGFQAVQSSEHMASLGVFGLCQLYAFVSYVRSRLTAQQFSLVLRFLATVVGGTAVLAFLVLTATGKIAPWTGRFYSLLDPSYAKNYIPIIASVSEHQPTAWASYYFDLQILVFLFPVGLYYCFTRLTDANIFIILYGMTSLYFSSVMVRLMLVLAPVMCILSGIGASSCLEVFMANVKASEASASQGSGASSGLQGLAAKLWQAVVGGPQAAGDAEGDASVKLEEKKVAGAHKPKQKKQKRTEMLYPYRGEIATAVVCAVTLMLATYATHCVWVSSEAYSSPSIVLAARGHDDSKIIFDDFRDAYYWLRYNTAPDAKIMSWWDYGYQITAIANRTVLVDNNTWNNTHISRVGQAMSSTEDRAYEIMRELDVDYVLVIFGGYVGYSSDDINKFLWMVRIGGSTDRGRHIKEPDYYTKEGEFRVDKGGSSTLLNCFMYKMSYYRFGSVYTEHGKPPGYDRVRTTEIGHKDYELETVEEVFTSEHWIVRIYKVKKLPNRAAAPVPPPLPTAAA